MLQFHIQEIDEWEECAVSTMREFRVEISINLIDARVKWRQDTSTKGDERNLFVIHRQLHKFSCCLYVISYLQRRFLESFSPMLEQPRLRKNESTKLKFDTHIFRVLSLILWKTSDTLGGRRRKFCFSRSAEESMPKKSDEWSSVKPTHCHSKLLHFLPIFAFVVSYSK
jgi:hypothetical protein